MLLQPCAQLLAVTDKLCQQAKQRDSFEHVVLNLELLKVTSSVRLKVGCEVRRDLRLEAEVGCATQMVLDLRVLLQIVVSGAR
jgi:hypothetical protein